MLATWEAQVCALLSLTAGKMSLAADCTAVQPWARLHMQDGCGAGRCDEGSALSLAVPGSTLSLRFATWTRLVCTRWAA